MLRSLYDWVMEKARHPKAIWWLAGVSFAESSFFPIPPDVMLVPMVLADRRHAWRIAGVGRVTVSLLRSTGLGWVVMVAPTRDSGVGSRESLRIRKGVGSHFISNATLGPLK